mmetsp:Transcript_6718/g.15498  ORF Transcript_6718/g.15498 Transcript_6718/m.15498 type:complete len:254 (-) Transcript_6718:1176-1937(-)
MSKSRNVRLLRGLIKAVRSLLSLNRDAWEKVNRNRTELFDKNPSHDEQEIMIEKYRTNGGRWRVLELPLCPLSSWGDQQTRDEIDAVIPGLYQSNWRGAENLERMKKLGITHVLSTLSPDENLFPRDLVYLNLAFEDDEKVDPTAFLELACDFISQTMEVGACLVHCNAGISRSSALTLAYLVKRRGFTLREALRALRERRPIAWPNQGFMSRLIDMEEILRGWSSLSREDYAAWSERDPEAIRMAKLVDRGG